MSELAAIDPQRVEAIRDRIREVGEGQREIVEALLRPADLLIELQALAPGVLRDEPEARARFSLRVIESEGLAVPDRGSGQRAGAAGGDPRPLIRRPGLWLVAIAALRIGGREYLKVLRSLVVATAPARLLERQGADASAWLSSLRDLLHPMDLVRHATLAILDTGGELGQEADALRAELTRVREQTEASVGPHVTWSATRTRGILAVDPEGARPRAGQQLVVRVERSSDATHVVFHSSCTGLAVAAARRRADHLEVGVPEGVAAGWIGLASRQGLDEASNSHIAVQRAWRKHWPGAEVPELPLPVNGAGPPHERGDFNAFHGGEMCLEVEEDGPLVSWNARGADGVELAEPARLAPPGPDVEPGGWIAFSNTEPPRHHLRRFGLHGAIRLRPLREHGGRREFGDARFVSDDVVRPEPPRWLVILRPRVFEAARAGARSQRVHWTVVKECLSQLMKELHQFVGALELPWVEDDIAGVVAAGCELRLARRFAETMRDTRGLEDACWVAVLPDDEKPPVGDEWKKRALPEAWMTPDRVVVTTPKEFVDSVRNRLEQPPTREQPPSVWVATVPGSFPPDAALAQSLDPTPDAVVTLGGFDALAGARLRDDLWARGPLGVHRPPEQKLISDLDTFEERKPAEPAKQEVGWRPIDPLAEVRLELSGDVTARVYQDRARLPPPRFWLPVARFDPSRPWGLVPSEELWMARDDEGISPVRRGRGWVARIPSHRLPAPTAATDETRVRVAAQRAGRRSELTARPLPVGVEEPVVLRRLGSRHYWGDLDLDDEHDEVEMCFELGGKPLAAASGLVEVPSGEGALLSVASSTRGAKDHRVVREVPRILLRF